MTRRHVLPLTLFCVLLLGACAPPIIPRAKMADTVTFRKCADSPVDVIREFIRGIAELSLSILRSLIPDGTPILAIFGDGDEKRGRAVVKDMVDHPEIQKGSDVGSAYEILRVESDSADQHRVLIERSVSIIPAARSGKSYEETYHRWFRVAVHPESNCITSVAPIDIEWKLVQ
ncbi:MAG: hypothetical protein HYT40_00665 [Candidatus Sungbacteria bacterium]|uniref:Uncharacterized protein n=1 Tax=Candidatus Sungiibacteriota bacterium TaxID=2750080 RepID=A0A931SBA5_9BACT|nr:hypothetical protein [Candidatus Sungbacteria bacterium]